MKSSLWFLLAALAVMPGAPAIAGGADPTLQAMVPPDLAAAKVIKGGSSLTTPPLYTFAEDGKAASGVLIDLIDNAATYLGMAVEWQQIPYGAIVPAMDSGKIQISGSQFSATDDNLQRANIVSVYKNTVALVVPRADGAKVKAFEDMCGLSIAVVRGSTIEQPALDRINAACGKAGKDLAKAAIYGGAADALVAVKSRRVAGFLLSLAPAQHMAATTGEFSVVFGERFDVYSSGFAVAKRQEGLARALSAAINQSIADGSYGRIMERWKMPGILFADQSVVNKKAQ